MTIYDFLAKRNILINNKPLMEEAFTHSSFANEHRSKLKHNERLEFMGDAVLQIYSSKRIFKLEPPLPEGNMTTLRANLVNEKALAKYVRKFQLNKYLKLGAGEEKTGGRNRDSVIADMFEAFIGALFLDQGYLVTEKLLDEIMGDEITISNDIVDYKTKLQEYVQADKRSDIEYQLLSSRGPSNSPIFEMAVKVDGILLGIGSASSKKEAQKLAAKNALEKLVK
ncbi:MAG: ribonuclease III [Erysipelotrichaceae bacterium]|nr:ribonuclease III [Erysipelotrichaceae bacterium]